MGMLLLCFSQSMLRCGSFPSLPCERLVLVLVRFFLCALLIVLISVGHCCAPPLAVEVIIVGECRISVSCGVALLLAALNLCCHSRTRGCLACALRGSYVCFAPRDM